MYPYVKHKGWAAVSSFPSVAWTPVKQEDRHSSSSAINLESQFNLKIFIEPLTCVRQSARYWSHRDKQDTAYDPVAFCLDGRAMCLWRKKIKRKEANKDKPIKSNYLFQRDLVWAKSIPTLSTTRSSGAQRQKAIRGCLFHFKLMKDKWNSANILDVCGIGNQNAPSNEIQFSNPTLRHGYW